MTVATTLSLRELETFDPTAPERGGRERRFCCPLPPCDEKPINASHRSLAVNADTGAWCCHRCGAHGKLTEWWEERPREDRSAHARRALRRTFSLAPAPPPPAPSLDWRQKLSGIRPLSGTPGARYVLRRGISLELAHMAGVRFSPDWYGRAAVVFPVRDREGALVGAQGRYIDRSDEPKTRSVGHIKLGVFASPGALEAVPLVITEAPFDALTLALASYPALALIGTAWPEWLPGACAFRQVLIATDADEAGDLAAIRLEGALLPLGARVTRLRPWKGKDWNELAPLAREALAHALREIVGGAIAA